jgi:DNA end-binding protein Ku
MICPEGDTPVSSEHIVRGYKVKPDQYVVITDDDIDAISPKRSRTIEIEQFVDAASIPSIYYRRPYYLVPSNADKPYRLLVDTLAKTGKAGITQFVMYSREYLAAIVSLQGVLCLVTLYYQKEIREVGDVAGDGKAQPAQVRAISEAIASLSGKFEPARLRDVYEERVAALIRRKRQREGTIEIPSVEAKEGEGEKPEAVDLIAALEESLAVAGRRTR